MTIAIAFLIGGVFVAIIVTTALRRLLGDMLPALSASAVIMGVALRLAEPFGNAWSLPVVVLGSHAVAWLAIAQADKRRAS